MRRNARAHTYSSQGTSIILLIRFDALPFRFWLHAVSSVLNPDSYAAKRRTLKVALCMSLDAIRCSRRTVLSVPIAFASVLLFVCWWCYEPLAHLAAGAGELIALTESVHHFAFGHQHFILFWWLPLEKQLWSSLFPYVALVINLVGVSFLKQMHRPCQSVPDRVIVRYYFLGINITKNTVSV